MKKLIFFVLALAVTSITSAQGTMLRIRLSDRSAIAVELDGRYYDKGTTSLTLDNLHTGPHRIIVFSVGGYNVRPERIYTGTLRLERGTSNTAIVDINRRSLRLRTEPADVEYADGSNGGRGSNGYGNDNYGGHRRPNGGNRNDDVYSDRSNNYGNNNSNNDYDNRNDSRTPQNGSEEGYGSFPHGRGNSAHGTNSQQNSLLSQRDMDDLASRIKARMTDTDKEQMLKNVLGNRIATTDQIRLMLSWLSFDSSRLDFAKWAYSRSADPRNYWKLEDVFSFSSSKEEFSKSINGGNR